MNKFIGVGNLGRDVSLRHTNGGTAVADVSLAISERFKKSDGSYMDQTVWLNLEFWARNAEVAAEYLRKGSSVLIEGSLKEDSWEKDGVKQSRLKVRVDKFKMLDSRNKNESTQREETQEQTQESETELVGAGTGPDNIPF